MADYYVVTTNIGEAKMANALALGIPIAITELALGDGEGDGAKGTPVPNPEATQLVSERRRAPINSFSVDPENSNVLIAEQVVPETAGGWWIREMGLFDEDGDLIFVCNTPPTYKPQLSEGSGRTQVVRMASIVSNTSAVTLKVDPSVVLATREYADQLMAEHKSEFQSKIDSRVIWVGSVAEGFSGLSGINGSIYRASGFLDDSRYGGGDYEFKSEVLKSQHDGIHFVSPTVPPIGQQAGATIALKEAAFKNGTGESDPGGTGVFVRIIETSAADPSVQKTTSAVAKSRIQNKAIVSFCFDDAFPSATGSVRALFDSKGLKCGLAVPSYRFGQASAAKVNDLLDMQRDGYEILNHGFGSVTMASSADNPNLVESEINGGLFQLQKYGFDVQGFVAPQSNLSTAWTTVLQENHLFGFTNGIQNVSTSNAFQAQDLDPYRMHRTSLFGLGVDGCKSLIDLAIEGNGYVQFYDHDPDQVYFPNSLSLAELTQVLDYAIDRGAVIVTPREAFDLLHGSATRGRSIEQNSVLNVRRISPNYLLDSRFRAIKRNNLDGGSSAWRVDGVGLAGTYSVETPDPDIFAPAKITLAADQTAESGRVLVENLSNFISGQIRAGSLTFQVVIQGENSASGEDLRVTIGLNYRKQSDSAFLAGNEETTELYIDGNPRLYTITLSLQDYSEPAFVTGFVRIVPKTSNGGTVYLSQPMLHDADRYAIYQPNFDFLADKQKTAFDSTTLPNATFTQMNLVAKEAVTNSFTATGILIKSAGTYNISGQIRAVDPGFTVGNRGILEYRVNGSATESERFEAIASDGVLIIPFSISEYFNKGDELTFFIFQGSGADLSPAFTTNSFVTACMVS